MQKWKEHQEEVSGEEALPRRLFIQPDNNEYLPTNNGYSGEKTHRQHQRTSQPFLPFSLPPTLPSSLWGTPPFPYHLSSSQSHVGASTLCMHVCVCVCMCEYKRWAPPTREINGLSLQDKPYHFHKGFEGDNKIKLNRAQCSYIKSCKCHISLHIAFMFNHQNILWSSLVSSELQMRKLRFP